MQRKIEVFGVGSDACRQVVRAIDALAHPSWRVEVHDMHDPGVTQRARALGVHRVPAILVDGQLTVCDRDRRLDLRALRALEAA